MAKKSPLDPEVLSKVSGLNFRVQKIVEGYVTGLHKSPYHGFSVEFAQHRQYSPGDDIRYIDWKVFGKTDRFYIKEYEEETNMKVAILLDCSESMKYGSGGLTKYEYGSCIAATLSYVLLNQQDSVGLTLFDNSTRAEISPSTNPGMLRNIVTLLENTVPSAETKIGELFLKVLTNMKRKGLIIIISDFFVDFNIIQESLKHLSTRGHAVFLFHVMDKAELSFPFERLTLFKGLEHAGDTLINPGSVRAAYLKEVGDFLNRLKKESIKRKINYYLINTSDPLDVVLSSILTTHGGRKKQ